MAHNDGQSLACGWRIKLRPIQSVACSIVANPNSSNICWVLFCPFLPLLHQLGWIYHNSPAMINRCLRDVKATYSFRISSARNFSFLGGNHALAVLAQQPHGYLINDP